MKALSGAQTKGGDVVVTVTYASFTQAVPFRVWYPTTAFIQADDMTLNRVATPACTNGETPTYQSTELHAYATLSTTGGAQMIGVDVTPHTAFALAAQRVRLVQNRRNPPLVKSLARMTP